MLKVEVALEIVPPNLNIVKLNLTAVASHATPRWPAVVVQKWSLLVPTRSTSLKQSPLKSNDFGIKRYAQIFLSFCHILSSLKGAARFTEQDGRPVLYLDGTPGTFAETPALPIQQTDLSITVWIKRSPISTSRQMIYSDWSSPHQFRFDVMTDARLCVDVRRDSSVVTGLLNFCTPFRYGLLL